MNVTSDTLSKKAIALYEATVVGDIFCVLTDSKAKRIRFFGIKTFGSDAEELYFPLSAVVGFGDAATIKNRSALRGRFSLPGGLKKIPIGGDVYTPDGKRIGALDSVETENGEIISFTSGGTVIPSARLVTFSDTVLIVSETDDKYRVVPPRSAVPKVRDERIVTINSAANKTEVPAAVITVRPPQEAKSTAYPVPESPEKADTPPSFGDKNKNPTNDKTVVMPVKATATTDKQNPIAATVKPVVLPPVAATVETDLPPVRSSVVLPPRADVTVTRTPPIADGKIGYSFLIGKTMTRTLLGDDGEVIAANGETISSATLEKAAGKLVLLALYSK